MASASPAYGGGGPPNFINMKLGEARGNPYSPPSTTFVELPPATVP